MPDAELDTRGFYSPPWHHGFDESFVTKSAMPTWNPTITPWDIWANKKGEMWTTSFYLENKSIVKDNLKGDDTRVIMDRAIPFMEEAKKNNTPFIACLWLHTPHEPVVAGPAYKAMYSNYSEDAQHYYGAITAMDEQIGRLRNKLRQMDIAENTIVWFMSDNGPSKGPTEKGIASAGIFRGSKHTIYEGGIRVPSIIEWPGRIEPSQQDVMCSTNDMMPTLLALINSEYKSEVPLDGTDILSFLENSEDKRGEYLYFGWQQLYQGLNQQAVMDDQYKLIVNGNKKELYDLKIDPGESNNIIKKNKKKLKELETALAEWNHSTLLSREGADYKY